MSGSQFSYKTDKTDTIAGVPLGLVLLCRIGAGAGTSTGAGNGECIIQNAFGRVFLSISEASQLLKHDEGRECSLVVC